MLGVDKYAQGIRQQLRRLFVGDALDGPIGRASDSSIDEALSARGLTRQDLFTAPNARPRHRRRLAAMLAMHGLSPAKVTAQYWRELKEADHRCAHCANPRRCESWLRWQHENDAPRMFCPNARTLETWKADGGDTGSSVK